MQFLSPRFLISALSFYFLFAVLFTFKPPASNDIPARRVQLYRRGELFQWRLLSSSEPPRPRGRSRYHPGFRRSGLQGRRRSRKPVLPGTSAHWILLWLQLQLDRLPPDVGLRDPDGGGGGERQQQQQRKKQQQPKRSWRKRRTTKKQTQPKPGKSGL